MRPGKINENELMQYYGLKGAFGKIKLYAFLIGSWILHSLAWFSPSTTLTVILQRARGVKIGKDVFIGPYVSLDLIYPHLITIEDYVSIGMNTMIFTHSNPTNSIYLKENYYPRIIKSVLIRKGAWIAPGNIILCGVTLGENCILGAGSVLTKNIGPFEIFGGIPAKLIKQLVPKNSTKNNS